MERLSYGSMIFGPDIGYVAQTEDEAPMTYQTRAHSE